MIDRVLVSDGEASTRVVFVVAHSRPSALVPGKLMAS
jgi:hypothetical protein